MSKKLTLEHCKKAAAKNNGKCISKEYVDNKTDLEWECAQGHRWKATYRNVATGNKTWCPICYETTDQRGASQKLTIEEVREKIESYGLELVSTEYISSKDKLKVRCFCGEIWEITYNDLQQKARTCRKCAVPKRKNTNMERYGVNMPSQKLEFARKAARNSTMTTMIPHWKTKEKLACTASYEVAVVRYFNKNKINFDWQPKAFQMPGERTYTPDCYLPDEDLWIEIKGYFRKDAKEKWDWFQSEHSNSELWNEVVLKEKKIL